MKYVVYRPNKLGHHLFVKFHDRIGVDDMIPYIYCEQVEIENATQFNSYHIAEYKIQKIPDSLSDAIIIPYDEALLIAVHNS